MDDNTQSILLERYLLALQADSSAPPPPNLDPELAQMAQRLGAYSHIKAHPSAKKRIWETVMTEFEKSSQKTSQKEQSGMLATKTVPQKKSSSWMWMAIATLIFGLAFAVAIVANNRPTPPQFGAGIGLEQGDATHTSPTIIPSETMITDSPPAGYVPVVTVYVPIQWGMLIREDMLIITYWEASRVPTGAFSRIEDVAGMLATADIPRFLPLTGYMVIDGTTAMTGVPNTNYLLGMPTSIMPMTATPIIDPISSLTFTPTPLIEATPSAIFTPTLMASHTPTATATNTFTPTPRP